MIKTFSFKLYNSKKNKKLHQQINLAGFANFVSILKYEASLNGTEIIEIDTFYPSSQLCSVCDYRNQETKDLSVREWTCPECHTHHDRDRNATINILKVGTSTEYERWCKTDVSQQPSSAS